MKTNPIFVFSAAFILLFACKADTNNPAEAWYDSPEQLFGAVIELTGEATRIPSDQLRHVYELVMPTDSLLILSDPDPQYHFSLVNLNQPQRLLRFGKIGDGPYEVSFPTSIQYISKDTALGLFVRKRWLYYEYRLADIWDKAIQPRIKHGPFHTNYQLLVKRADSTFWGVGYFGHRFAVSEPGGKVVSQWLDYPFRRQLSHGINGLAMAYQGHFSLSPSHNHMGFATIYAPNLILMHFGSDSIPAVDSVYSRPPLFVGGDNPQRISIDLAKENKMGYLDLATTNDQVFVLYSGKRLADQNAYESTMLLVFDWRGRPLTRYKLDTPVKKFTVSANGQTLYAFVDTPNPYIIKYQLPGTPLL